MFISDNLKFTLSHMTTEISTYPTKFNSRASNATTFDGS